jgi:hypothetical protein
VTTETHGRDGQGRGQPPIDPVPADLPPDLVAIVDGLIVADGTGMTRPDALRRIVREWAIAHDFVVDETAGATLELEELNAENDG